MPSESYQHRLDRVRRPRVQITYDVQTGDAMERVELPFVVGVMADLTGNPDPEHPLRPLKERKFVEVDRDNLPEVMRRSQPRLVLTVKDRLANTPEVQRNVELTFASLEDFEPASVARKVVPELLRARNRLAQLLSKMEGNDRLEAELEAILGEPDHAIASRLLQAMRKGLPSPSDGSAGAADASVSGDAPSTPTPP